MRASVIALWRGCGGWDGNGQPTIAAGSPAKKSALLGWPPRSMSSWTRRLEALLARQRRVILGITGPPGAGKTAMAAAITSSVDGAVQLPMDGFHLADVELQRLGRIDRKGAIDTFDAYGYLAL